ncbi:MAG: hypothetical protein BM556_12005 [Bacteriovorax sp. MedPE-SWde]|nr:MAG: hypothetical protein BM556_12005 [Bacteriovorax sp. MedPE-SWde]
MGANHHHHHHHHELPSSGKRLLAAILMNIAITVIQVVGGLISGSSALLADAFHNFSDVMALVLSWMANIFSNKKTTSNSKYGYKRAEILAAFINSATLIIIALYLISEAFEKFYNPVPINGTYLIVLGTASVVLNALSMWIITPGTENSLNMKSAYLHLLSDMVTSLGVVVGGLCMIYFKITWIDSALTLAIAVYLIFSSFKLLRRTVRIIMQLTPEDLDIEVLKNEIEKNDLVNNIHDIHVWEIKDNQNILQAHVNISENIEQIKVSQLKKKIKKDLKEKFNVQYATLEMEFGSEICI